jgi:aspartyl-tRNA(Asn)/glutamyl-tRNA(Gln) amidotransferase subunit A
LFSFSSIKDYQSLLFSGKVSCVEAVSFYLQNIKANNHLNAFLEVYEEEALEYAALLDANRKSGNKPGKLHGVIVGLKDVISYRHHKVSASSKILENFQSVYNATVTERLLREEVIIIGRQNCDEFAMGSSNENSAFGNVLNPIDNTRVPGGSSGGSAVSVQANLCMVSLGSDTGGSIRQPADFCGIVGLKPSYGRVSRYGLIAYASSFDQIGIFSKTVYDAALVLDVIAGADDYDSTTISEPFKHADAKKEKFTIGYFPSTLEHNKLDPEIARSQKNFINQLSQQNIEVKAIDFDLLEYIVPAYYVLTTAEASSNLSRYDGIKFGKSFTANNLADQNKLTRSKYFGKEVKRRIMLGTFVLSEGYYDAYVAQAQKIRRILIKKTNQIFSQVDAIISPVSPTTAFKFNQNNTDPVEMFLADIFTVYANLTGIPAISIPLFKHSNGMPFGVQLMASHANELILLQLSKKLIEIKENLN